MNFYLNYSHVQCNICGSEIRICMCASCYINQFWEEILNFLGSAWKMDKIIVNAFSNCSCWHTGSSPVSPVLCVSWAWESAPLSRWWDYSALVSCVTVMGSLRKMSQEWEVILMNEKLELMKTYFPPKNMHCN